MVLTDHILVRMWGFLLRKYKTSIIVFIFNQSLTTSTVYKLIQIITNQAWKIILAMIPED